MSRRIVSCAALALTLSLAALAPGRSEARSLEDALVGKVALSKRALPGKKGQKAYVRALARSARGRAVFWEDPKEQGWRIHYAVVLSRPLRSGDLTLTLFDTSHGKQFIGTREKMMFGHSRIATGSFTLKRNEVFDPNARLLLVVQGDGDRVLARRTFYIQGKAETYSGEVSFEDDAAGAQAQAPADQAPRHRRH